MWCQGDAFSHFSLLSLSVSVCYNTIYLSNTQKFVSTTLRPAPTNHPELHMWEGCAAFVADFINLEPLDPPHILVWNAHTHAWFLKMFCHKHLVVCCQSCLYFAVLIFICFVFWSQPLRLRSPSFVLKTQKASCFEYATVLCCLLLGSDYDAYCVSGYAVRQMCLLDQSLKDCPLVYTKLQVTTFNSIF